MSATSGHSGFALMRNIGAETQAGKDLAQLLTARTEKGLEEISKLCPPKL